VSSIRRAVSALAVLVLLSGCATQATAIRVPMGYAAPSVQFAPWYVALQKGYFAAEGLEIEFEWGWETNGVRLVGAGELPFAVASGDQVLLARAQGLPIVGVVNWFRRFPVAIMALEDSGITQPGDLAGRPLGIPETFGASYIGWRALGSSVGLSDDDVQLEVIGYTQGASLVDERVDAAVVYANNEPIQLELQGYNVITFAVADYADLVSNGIITNEETITENPDLVRAFVRAFVRGVGDTLADPDEAFDICRDYVEGLEANEEAQRAVFDATLEYWRGEPLCAYDPAAWEEMSTVMLEAGLLSTTLDVESSFSNAFLP
jgi:NitT/TauT family transport system substrate-binding protein